MQERLKRSAWLDIARLAAVALVSIQHALSASAFHPPDLLLGLDAGQIGVTMFFSLSGFLVFHAGEKDSVKWLRRRFSRILIPYWIAVSVVLIANQVTGHKPASPELVLSQLAGTAAWTHEPEKLIGIHFWFVSVLLVCYLLGALARSIPRLLPLLVIAAAVWTQFSELALYILVFVSAAMQSGWRLGTTWPALTLLVLAALMSGFNTGIAVILTCLLISALTIRLSRTSLPVPIAIAAPLARAAELSYHFYLVHGPVCLGTAKVFGASLVVVLVLGTAFAVVAACILHVFEAWLRRRMLAPLSKSLYVTR